MNIIEASIKDAPLILALQKDAYLSEAALHDDFSIPPLTQTLAELKDDFSFKKVLKVTLDNCLVASGQIYLVEDSCHIGRMAVRPDLCGQGISSKLLSALESYFPEAKRFELFTGANSTSNFSNV